MYKGPAIYPMTFANRAGPRLSNLRKWIRANVVGMASAISTNNLGMNQDQRNLLQKLFTERLIRQMTEHAQEFASRTRFLSTQYQPDSPSHLAALWNDTFPDHQINQETARKWLREKGLPNRKNLGYLVKLLKTTADYLCPYPQSDSEGALLEFNSFGRPPYEAGASKWRRSMSKRDQEIMDLQQRLTDLLHLRFTKRKRPA
jgi:hypothetical protein